MATDASQEPSNARVRVVTTVRLSQSMLSLPFMHRYSRSVSSPVTVELFSGCGETQADGKSN